MEIESPVVTGELRNEIATIEERTKNVVVRNPAEREAVYSLIQLCKTKKKSIVDFFADMKEKAFKAHRAISAAEKAETDKLDAFERAGKLAIQQYDEAENQKRIAEQRRLQAIEDERARKEREKAAQEAARQAEIEKQAREKAEAARRAAEAAGAAERAKLLAEADKADRQAAAAAVKSVNAATTVAEIVAPVVQVQAPAKLVGESVRKIWNARILDAKKIPIDYLAMWIDPKKVDDFARATKGNVPVAGIEFYFENSLSIRTK